ncbi:TIGR02530 family flagellar biosynthesis protein [Paenibacillus apiarius]|uniref:TIGR02530 family flagellar biosynthesis protein n=1 Tax=Paenibacillus apiarius TaxID=46240 RepID=UPI003B3B80F9
MNIHGAMGHIGIAGPIQGTSTQRTPQREQQVGKDTSFQRLLQHELTRTGDVQFSQHAKVRMQERGMVMSAEMMSKMQQAVKQAEDKGSRQSLIIVDNQAFIVNVKSRTVITALDQASQQNHVFTQIDSAILMK